MNDCANPAFEEQIASVEHILAELGLTNKKMLRVFNKTDLLADKSALPALCRRFGAVPAYALEPATFPPLMERLAEIICVDHQ